MFEELAARTPEISVNAKYWFLRTDQGTLYEAFIGTSSIAIGYGKIGLSVIKNLPADGEAAKEELKASLRRYYPPTPRADGKATDLSGLHAAQLLRFCREMKAGDVVIVPSESSERLGIGFITDDQPFEELLVYRNEKFSEFKKRRRVKWVRGVDRQLINPRLFKLFLNPQTIVDASNYSEWVDTLLYDFFKKGDVYHFVMRVGTTEEIKAQVLFKACLELFDLAQQFADSEKEKADFADVGTRINLNSPGEVEFWKSGPAIMGILAVLVVFLNGGGFTMAGEKFSLKTEGLLKRLSEFLNDRKRRQMADTVRNKLEGLDIKNPEQVMELLRLVKDDSKKSH